MNSRLLLRSLSSSITSCVSVSRSSKFVLKAQFYSSKFATAGITSTDNLPQHFNKPDTLDAEYIAKFSAFTQRTGLVNFKNEKILKQALIHQSYLDGNDAANERLQVLGESVLQFYVTEHLYLKYPELPHDILRQVIDAYIGLKALSSAGKTFGIPLVMKWGSVSSNLDPDNVPIVTAKVFQAIVAAIFTDQGATAAKSFIGTHIISRTINIEDFIKFPSPKSILYNILEKKGKPRPVGRILKETGRSSNSPVFIVGIFSGLEKLGEGYGSSLKMAEFRACRAALIEKFGTEVAEMPTPPSSVDESGLTFMESSPSS